MSLAKVSGGGALALLVSALVAGCTTADSPAVDSSCAGDATAVLEGIDWETAPVLEIAIRQDDFAPAVFGLLRDRPYVLRFANADDGGHAFESRAFFKNVAVESVTVDGEPLAATCLSRVAVPRLAVTEIRLVPVRDGRYEFQSGAGVDLGIGYELGYGIGTIFVY